MKSHVILLLLSLVSSMLIGQNLVLNPSFEELANSEMKGYASHKDLNENLLHWTSPTQATPDYHNAKPSILPEFQTELQPPATRTGEKMGGIHTYGYVSSTYCEKTTGGEIREYLQGTLSQPTVPGEAYFIRFWVRREQHSGATNNIGIVFLTEEIHNEGCYRLDLTPHFNEEDLMDAPSDVWQPITAKLTLQDTFRYFIIGNFFSNQQTQLPNIKSRDYHSYYYIDDVFISKVLTKEEIAALKAKRAMTNTASAMATSLAAAELNSPIPLEEVYFQTNSSALDPRSFLQLKELASWLKSSPSARILIKGHTDNRGNETYNQELSARRAASVAEYLRSQGAAEQQVDTRGYGSSLPKVQAGDAAALQANRRVEFEILSK
ncbi:MAG: OmpA family protein [Bacteroidota bacterium]